MDEPARRMFILVALLKAKESGKQGLSAKEMKSYAGLSDVDGFFEISDLREDDLIVEQQVEGKAIYFLTKEGEECAKDIRSGYPKA